MTTIKDIRERLDNFRYSPDDIVRVDGTEGHYVFAGDELLYEGAQDAADFIAAAPADIAVLLAEVTRLSARIAELEAEARRSLVDLDGFDQWLTAHAKEDQMFFAALDAEADDEAAF